MAILDSLITVAHDYDAFYVLLVFTFVGPIISSVRSRFSYGSKWLITWIAELPRAFVLLSRGHAKVNVLRKRLCVPVRVVNKYSICRSRPIAYNTSRCFRHVVRYYYIIISFYSGNTVIIIIYCFFLLICIIPRKQYNLFCICGRIFGNFFRVTLD